MTPRAFALTALFGLSPFVSGGVMHAQVQQGPAKPKPGAAAPSDNKATTAQTIRIHRSKATADGKVGEVCVVVEGRGDGVPKVKLHMDSIEVEARSTPAPGAAEGAGCPTQWDYVVPLVPGVQYVVATLYGEGDVAVAVARDSLIGKADSAAMTATLHILAVGINRYPAGVDSLSYARTDARAFADSLRRQSAPLFGTVRVDSLYDGDATRDSIITTLMDISDRVKPNDTFVFFFAGHGAMENGHLFLAGAEVNSLTNVRTLNLKGIRDDDLLNRMADIKGSTLMVLDACRSGQMITAFRNKESRARAVYRLQDESPPNLAILAATDSSGLAEENSQLRHGLFTAALLRGRKRGEPREIRGPEYLHATAQTFLKDWYLGQRAEVRSETHIWKPPTKPFDLVVR
ncbi:MAG TPA: caspase family protein [Gemmatimonadaceae bacterium]|nr:caspase family protein [Gemmatimonadaceae bacterium]